MSCDRAPSFLGAYVLGVLDRADRAQAEAHLATCPDCAAELAEFRGLTAQLQQLSAHEVVAGPVMPSPELYDRVAAAVHRPTRHRWMAVGAAAAALAVGGTTWLTLRDDGEVFRAAAGGVWATVAVEEANSGTALDVTVAGLREGSPCEVIVVDDAGEEHPVGDWTFPGGEKSWDVWSEVPPADLAGLSLQAGGKQVVWVSLDQD